MSQEFRGKCGKRKTHVFIIFPFHQCFAFVAKLYLSPHFPRLEAIKSISVPRLSGNYRNKRRFFDFFVLWEKPEDKHQLTGCLKITSRFSKVQGVVIYQKTFNNECISSILLVMHGPGKAKMAYGFLLHRGKFNVETGGNMI